MSRNPNQTEISTRPELLLPAGDFETFKAAIAGGADAVYLGIKHFNARERAHNFSWPQLGAALQIARKYKIKIFVTLNTVIKNCELDELIDTLHNLNRLKPDGIIVQDWGVWFLIRNFFPGLPIHASTQMGLHNSQGVNYAAHKGGERVIMARELTMPELKIIVKRSKAAIELFVHGALCYSFSGMCLFSSFIGGQGANRGLCKQPCRRLFTINNKQKYPFSLKDLQGIELIPAYARLGIHALKVEGRLKSVNYVFNVAKACQMVLSSPEKLPEARKLLQMDMGRDKTQYFAGGKVNNAITDQPVTGHELGKVQAVYGHAFLINTDIALAKGDRLRILHDDGTQTAFKIHKFRIKDQHTEIEKPAEELVKKGDKVFLASRKEFRFKEIETPAVQVKTQPINQQTRKEIFTKITPLPHRKKMKKRKNIFVRINDINWIKKVQFRDIEGLWLQLSPSGYDELRTNVPFIRQNLHKIYAELPAFIPEDSLSLWQHTIKKLRQRGIEKFVISHLSQQAFFNPKDHFITNENVYAFNDAAITMLKNCGIKNYTYPLENDMENLKKYRHTSGIVPVYFRPRLFFSRMPVKIDTQNTFYDDTNIALQYTKHNNLNYIYPQQPVAFTHHVDTFMQHGYDKFLVDFSFEKASQNRWKTVFKKIKFAEQLQPAFSFNIKKGLT